jgi:poly(hydroxyalkanoate) depolymerase family esterase
MNALAEEHRLLVVYPAQTGGDNSMSCWNWFRPGDQVRDSGESAIIAGLTENLRDQYAILKDRVFVAGLSAGGAMAAIMGETYPELYGGIGVHSGLAYGSANDVLSAFAAMHGQAGLERAPLRKGGAACFSSRITSHDVLIQGEIKVAIYGDFNGQLDTRNNPPLSSAGVIH